VTEPEQDPIDQSALAEDLVGPGSLWSGVEVVAETGSTNADLAAAARAGAASGSVLITGSQTTGKGRLGRTWVAPPGTGIALSVLLRPEVPAARWTWLPLLAGLAVSDALRQQYDLPADLKWPNDVLVGGRKISGVLAERVATGDGPAVVLGMGINVSLTAAQLPVPTATSITLALADLGVPGLQVSRTALAATVLRSLERIVRHWTDVDDDSGVALAYRERCSTLGRHVRVELGDGAVEGRAESVDSSGRLVLRTDEGLRVFGAGDVVHLR
jgi:BirA family biotin operon repressor/biotin-[acetyl-CoA-carboxylase] ligase